MSASPGALQAPSDHARAPAQPPKIAVGIALKREKRKKHISDKLVALAAEAGVELRFVEKDVPLEQQGPFVAIFQKVRKPGERAATATACLPAVGEGAAIASGAWGSTPSLYLQLPRIT